ncbi:DUF5985 family protein [Cellvibrio mixtus]|uniref:DUF5985 family protein n=1 Tax=Cellvibrio mixtus TaxID=39650 RepID=UPI000586659F|nr:DUF5985 family protein [Cellvibrio mixtus]
MAPIIYTLCALTSGICAILLLRSYFDSRYRLLLWAGVCFAGLTVNNVLMVTDKIFFAQENMLTLRLVVTLAALGLLLYGLIFDE